jgi:hypothetical protein
MLKSMREPDIIEAELIEINATADDVVKLERIIAWCAVHPDEIPFAMRILMGWRGKGPARH